MLPTSQADISCCSVNNGFSCAAGLLGIAQIGVQWSCFIVMWEPPTFHVRAVTAYQLTASSLLLYLVFTERHPADAMIGTQYPLVAAPHLLEAVVITAISVAHLVLELLVSVVIIARFPENKQDFANVLGIAAAILASVQYLPQIWLTWKLGHVGSLSIPMMLIQTPGGFVFAWSLASRLGPAGWSAWSVYLLLGSLQGVLLVMAICFIIRDHKEARLVDAMRNRDMDGVHDGQFEDEPEEVFMRGALNPNERTPLIRTDRLGRRMDGFERRRYSSVENIFDPARLIVDSESSNSDHDRAVSNRKASCNVA